MRIDPLRVSQSAPARPVAEPRNIPVSRPNRSSVSETTDLLAISAGVAVAEAREATVEELRAAYRSGALRPDPARIADKLMTWGFDIGAEGTR